MFLVCIRSKAMFKFIPLMCIDTYSYMFGILHPWGCMGPNYLMIEIKEVRHWIQLDSLSFTCQINLEVTSIDTLTISVEVFWQHMFKLSCFIQVIIETVLYMIRKFGTLMQKHLIFWDTMCISIGIMTERKVTCYNSVKSWSNLCQTCLT